MKNNNPEKNKGGEADFFSLVQGLLENLPARSREIVAKRYGLFKEKRETLEQIGREYGITRERVRQIIADALKVLSSQEENPGFKKAENLLVFTIEKNNGIIKEEDIVRKFGSGDFRQANAVRLFGDFSRKIETVEEKNLIEKSWVFSKDVLKNVRKTAEEARRILEKKEHPMTREQLIGELSKAVPECSKNELLSRLSVLKKIKKNVFGKWGIFNWSEITPKGSREKIYLVLKEEKKPLHFTEIAKLIDKYKLGKKKAHPQTVHNELIKDDRFVLIGRGIYALSEWGYSEGTIKDVLREILEKSQRPLTKEEILSKIFQMRKVKKTTVMINLNNNKVFVRNKNLYTVRKK